jgi:hypothetical protein
MQDEIHHEHSSKRSTQPRVRGKKAPKYDPNNTHKEYKSEDSSLDQLLDIPAFGYIKTFRRELVMLVLVGCCIEVVCDSL